MKKRNSIVTLTALLILLTLCFSGCSKKADDSFEVTFLSDTNESISTVSYKSGSLIERPKDPLKSPTVDTVYTFKGWYAEGSDTAWSFENDTVTSDVTLKARYDEKKRLYSVTIGDDTFDVEYSSLLTEPEVPTLPEGTPDHFVFDGWYLKDADVKWDFSKDTVKENVILVAKFREPDAVGIVFSIAPECITVNGNSYPLLAITENDYTSSSVEILTQSGELIKTLNASSSGKAQGSLLPGSYRYEVSTPHGKVDGKLDVSGSEEISLDIVIKPQLAKKSTMGTKNDPYIYNSYPAGFGYAGGALRINSYTYIYLGDGSLTDKMYLEADVNIPEARVGSMVGIMAACEYGNISGDANKALQGSTDILKKKLIFCVGYDTAVYSQSISGYSSSNIIKEVSLDKNDYSDTTHKLGVLRNGDYYFVFVNGNHVLTYFCDDYDKCGFGFCLTTFTGGGSYVAEYKNIKYITDEETISKMTSDIAGETSITYNSDEILVTQSGKEIKDGKVVCAEKVSVSLKSAGVNSLFGFTVTENGKEIDTEINGMAVEFTPKPNCTYDISADYSGTISVSLDVTLKPYEIILDGVAYPLSEFDIDPSKASITLTKRFSDFKFESKISDMKHKNNITDTTFNLGLENGLYLIEVKYESNIFSREIALYDNASLTVYASDAYLGADLKLGGNVYHSFSDAPEGATSGSGWELVDGTRNSVRVTNYTYLFHKNEASDKYYVEGVFDAKETEKAYLLSKGFSGLLVAHGPNELAHTSDVKIMAAIYGKSVVLCISENWEAKATHNLANYTEYGIEADGDVKLGVLRDKNEYYFFVDDILVAKRTLDNVTGACGVGVASLPSDVTVREFNYSANPSLINALKACELKKNTSVDIYLIAGQSNASGYTLFDKDSLLSKNDRYIYGSNSVLYAGRAQYTVNGSTTGVNEFDFGLAMAGQGFNCDRMGAEVSMANVLADYYSGTDTDAAIIKFAHGGTALLNSHGGENACDGNWVPPSYAAAKGYAYEGLTGGLYRKLLLQVEQRIDELKAMGYTEINIKGIFWMQGESDKYSANEYKTAFTYFVSDIRRDLGEIVGVDLSNLAIIVGEISRTSGDAMGSVSANKAFIRMQQKLPESIDGVYVVASGDLDINERRGSVSVSVGTDAWHWSEKDMLLIGEMVGQSIVENVLAEK